jgi:hypothetical protein
MTKQKVNRKIAESMASAPTGMRTSPEAAVSSLESLEGLPENLRDRVQKLLLKSSPKPLDKAELIKSLDLKSQFENRCEVLAHCGFYEQPVFSDVELSFRPRELEIATSFQEPTLLLIPDCSTSQLRNVLDSYANRLEGQGEIRINHWKAVIVDGAIQMKAYNGDDPKKRVIDRISSRFDMLRPSEKGMDLRRYLMLMLAKLGESGTSVDPKGSATFLDDQPDRLGDDKGLYACWRDGRIVIDDEFDEIDPITMFRSSVGGDKILSRH